jgi:hypothetical protein
MVGQSVFGGEVRKCDSIIPADTALAANPDVAFAVFVNTHVPVVGKPTIGCKVGNGAGQPIYSKYPV